jgi:vacuolar-type H+-ATPase subunit E/Vma4
MTAQPTAGATRLEQPTRALLELIESDRARQCAQILGEAYSRAAAIRAQAHAAARARMRQAFDEQRQRRREQIAAAQARLATHRRLHEQQRTAALLQLAWQQLPDELRSLWQQSAARSAWVTQVLAAAQTRMPHGPWRIVHAPDWPGAERDTLAQRLAEALGATPRFEADTAIDAGLKIVSNGNVIDGTLDGLLADRTELEAQLLRQLESPR